MNKKGWENLSGRGLPKGTCAKGRWTICFSCDGYGKNINYMGQPFCEWCNGTGKRWEVKMKASATTKIEWLERCEKMVKK